METDGGTFSIAADTPPPDPVSVAPPPADAARSPTAPSVGAGHLRAGLQLTPHQLGELTRRLGLDVGGRPNYPQYSRAEVDQLIAVQALRELLVPVEDACVAVSTFKESVVDGRGWIVCYPTPERWVSVAARAVEALASLLTLTGRAAILDLAALRQRSDTAWLHLLVAQPDS